MPQPLVTSLHAPLTPHPSRFRVCRVCDTRSIDPNPHGRKRRFCSDGCKQKAYRRRVKRNAQSTQKALRKKLIRFSQNSVEWYTPPRYIAAVKEVLGTIELDPASCEQANTTVQATRFFDTARDGLSREWQAETVFLNPPYCKVGNVSSQLLWTQKLITAYQNGDTRQAILLANAATDTAWFTPLYAYPLCFVKGRIRFITKTSDKTNGHTIGSVFVYLGNNPEKFITVFQKFGVIVKPMPHA